MQVAYTSATSLTLAMPPPSRREREVTILPGNLLNGPKRLAGGNFILAALNTVMTDEFWTDYGHNVGMIVNCIGERQGRMKIVYPELAAKSQVYYIDAHSNNFAEQFTRSCPAVQKTLERKQDVVVHCRESFHRAPAIWAGYQVRICQHENYQAFY